MHRTRPARVIAGGATLPRGGRISATGNLGVGGATTEYGSNYGEISVNGATVSLVDLKIAGVRLGSIVQSAGATNVKAIGAAVRLVFGVVDADRWEIDTSGHFRPAADNVADIGASGRRVREIFAGNATINTSDERLKRWRGPLNAAELGAARAIATELGMYQWLASLAEKGEAARLHCGVRAQRVAAILEQHGLDPFAYSFLCFDAWADELDEVLEEVTIVAEDGSTSTAMLPTGEQRVSLEAGERFGIRSSELLFFLIAAQEQRLAALEAA